MNADAANTLTGSTTLRAITTCHSTWLLDEDNRRFRRILRHPLVRGVSTSWRAYERLVVDRSGEAFLVVLDRAGTRVLRGRRCGRDCGCPSPRRRAAAGVGTVRS